MQRGSRGCRKVLRLASAFIAEGNPGSADPGLGGPNLGLCSTLMKYAALLRGIGPSNPNMRNEKLRGVFQRLGFENVQTVISSGNVLFESSSRGVKTLESTIDEAIEEQLGFTTTTIIRSHQQLKRLLDDNPFGRVEDSPTSRLNVTFLKQKPRTDLRFPYQAENKGYTVVGMHGRDVCSVVDLTGASTPDVMAWLEKQFGKAITTRTWKTVGRIVSRLDSGGR
jgi:uncharacterized protein (DUF1697 family)